jgi:hypothetical protein
MPSILTKTDVEILEVRFWQEESGWLASVGYRVNTAEGESWPRTLQSELAGSIKTKAVALHADIKNYVEDQEGL